MKNRLIFYNILVLLLTIFATILFSVSAYAYDAAYIARNPAFYNTGYKTMLENSGFTVDVIDSDDIYTFNPNNYDLLFVGDDYYSNAADIPVNDMPTMVINGYSANLKAWGISKESSILSSNQPIQGKTIISNQITEGFPEFFTIYTQAKDDHGLNIQTYFLSRFNKDPDIKTAISTVYNNNDPILAYIPAGTEIRYGITQDSRLCYYGIFEDEYWTNDARTLFTRCAEYAAFGFDNDGDGYGEDIDCDDSDPVVNPGAIELDDCIDNNCNGIIDEGFDIDGDGYTPICGHDCNDNDDTVFPGASELEDGKDNDCDGIIDEGTDAYDDDGDGFTENQGDCNDSDPAVNPDSAETCDGIDNDCDGTIDEQDAIGCSVFYYDGDSDTFGINDTRCLCSAAGLYNAVQDGDCDDSNPDINPGMVEIEGNDIDDDCNPMTFDGPTPEPPINVQIYADTNNLAGNNIILEWQSPEPNLTYNIYISDDYDISSFNFSAPSSVTLDNTFIDTAASLSQKKFYIVRAARDGINEENNTLVLGKFDIDLFNGYNIISLPLRPTDDSIDKVLHQDALNAPISEVKYIDNNLDKYIADFNTVTESWDSADNLDTMADGLGYFVYVDTPFTLTLTGLVLTEQSTFELSEGINLIGYASLEERYLWDIPELVSDGKITNIYQLSESGDYKVSTFYSSNDPYYWWSPDNLYILKPGKGYWFGSKDNFTINYNP